ncbi:MAG TPA: inorganic phosphate transporter [Longimicrobiales bacterium]|nr:inorganic phosphate transporter [Longimicrobiales bacterium]
MTPELLLLGLALAAGLYTAWTIGANDVANAMGTSVGSGALTLTAAIILAGIFEFGGAVLVGSSVTGTISKGIVQIELFEPTGPLGADGPRILALAMVAALFGCAAWLHTATHFGLPVSTTHSIVGAVAGVGIVTFGWSGVQWLSLLGIVASWVISPLLGGLIAFTSFVIIRKTILRQDDPVAATKRLGPYMVAVVVLIMMLSFIYKALKNRLDSPPLLPALAASAFVAVTVGVVSGILIRRTQPRPGARPYDYVERVFAMLQVTTACFVAFAHGANDVANAVGPVAAVVSLYQAGYSAVMSHVTVPFWVLVMGGIGIVVGLATLGYKVIATIGHQITEMTPTRGFSAEFGAATTVLIASSLGMPVSTTHTLVGGVIGVGFAQGIAALNVRTVRNIVNSWLATLPAAATVAGLLFLLGRAIIF